MNEDYIIPATARLIRPMITVSVSSSSNRSTQQHRQAISDAQDIRAQESMIVTASSNACLVSTPPQIHQLHCAPFHDIFVHVTNFGLVTRGMVAGSNLVQGVKALCLAD